MESGFFLGANSKHGFYSLYDNLIDLEDAKRVYIIKGSPGCGKSSFMRRIKDKVNKEHYVEQIFCSADPTSLDAIIIPDLKTAFVDGTAPHVIEPKFPIAVEHYINLGDFVDFSSLVANKQKIIDITKKYKSGFERVYNFLSVAGAIESELFDTALSGIDVSRLKKKAQGVISRELPYKRESGKSYKRFLSAISSNGYETNFDTPCSMAENIYVLEDNFGLGMFMLQAIADGASQLGYDTYLAYSPLTPARLEHLIIPQASLAFITSKKSQLYLGDYKRKIRIDTMINPEILKDKKKKLSFSRKLLHATTAEACTALCESKKLHDELENLYNPHVDFNGIYSLAESIAEDLLK